MSRIYFVYLFYSISIPWWGHELEFEFPPIKRSKYSSAYMLGFYVEYYLSSKLFLKFIEFVFRIKFLVLLQIELISKSIFEGFMDG